MKTTEQEARARAGRAANDLAKAEGAPLPYPNVWDLLDPTKLPADAPEDAMQASYARFHDFCRLPPRKRLSLS